MEDIGQFLFLLAFVIIAAIQWVVKQIQERNAPEVPDDDPLEDTWRELEEHHEQRRLSGEEMESEPDRFEQEPRRPASTNPFQELRNLFEGLKQQQEVVREVEPPRREAAQSRVAEVPLPLVRVPASKGVVNPSDLLNAAELEALRRLDAGEGASVPRAKKMRSDGGFRELLRGAGNLRKALILKEVFDRPLALRHEHSGESLSD